MILYNAGLKPANDECFNANLLDAVASKGKRSCYDPAFKLRTVEFTERYGNGAKHKYAMLCDCNRYVMSGIVFYCFSCRIGRL